jgi:hypothetical protein
MSETSTGTPRLACVILAHEDPAHLHRLIKALNPFPIFLHIDSRTPNSVFQEMTAALPTRVTLIKRQKTPWAGWGLVEAELEGYRLALQSTDATHIGLFSGSDYVLASPEEITSVLTAHEAASFAIVNRLPYQGWGASGGYARLRYPHWPFQKRMLRLPIPRSLPSGICFAGGSQQKILARNHVARLVRIAQENPDLLKFWRRSWIPDETFVYSLLSSPQFMPAWEDEVVSATLWWIDWGKRPRKSPPWMDMRHREILFDKSLPESHPVQTLFARKFSTDCSEALMDAIDADVSRRRQESTAKTVTAT